MNIENTIKNARENFNSGYNCCQSVMKSMLEEMGLDFKEMTLLSAGFGAGIGYSGETCGALTGAVMVIGILNGEIYDDPIEHKKATYEMTEIFLKKFHDLHSTTKCKELLGINITDKNMRDKASKENLYQKLCPNFIVDAITIISQIIDQQNKKT